MSLTQEQIAIRRMGIGASEVSALTGTSPYSEPIDVWLEKLGRVQRRVESSEMAVGTALETALLELYSARTGRRALRQHVTIRHEEFEHVLASPDAFVDDPKIAGVETKVVGWQMAHHWTDNTVPDYVLDQVRQNMAVFDAEAWDVCALVGGTDLRITTIERDFDHEATLIEACEVFWIEHVETKDPPEIRDPDVRRRMLLERYPGSDKTTALDVSDAPDAEEIADLMRWFEMADAMGKQIEAARDQLQHAICERIGDEYGITGPWGKFLWYPRAGNVNWKAIADELSHGAIPTELIEKHRGRPTRVPRLYPFTPKRPGLKRSPRP